MTQPPQGEQPTQGEQPPQDEPAASEQPEPLPPFPQPGPGQPPPGPGQGYGHPGYAPPPGYGQPGYGQYQPYPSPATGTFPPPGRDPALAEWWQRLLARLIDGIALAVLITPLWVAAFLPLWRRLQTLSTESPYLSPAAQHAFNNSVSQLGASMLWHFIPVAIAAAVISFGYDWLQHGLWGQTLGKRALGTRVVTAGSRSRISGGAACGRAAVYALIPIVPTIGGIFGLINELWLLWDPQRQCLHDKAAHTVVVKAHLVPAAAGQPNMSR